MGNQDAGLPEPVRHSQHRHQHAGPDRRRANLPFQGVDRREPVPSTGTRGHFDTEAGSYQLKSRSQGLYPELYEPVNKEFWRGISDDQAGALMRLQAIAMEKVGFEKGSPKFFIDDDPGSQYAADDYFVGGERARVATPKSIIGQSDAELAYAERRGEKVRWLKTRQDKRKRALQRESEADSGMNFLAASQAERLAHETALIAAARQPAVAEFDGPSLLIGGMLVGAGLFFTWMGLLPVFAAEYATLLAKVMPVAGVAGAGFGVVVLFNHMRS
jgi:hypothetical protein